MSMHIVVSIFNHKWEVGKMSGVKCHTFLKHVMTNCIIIIEKILVTF